MLRSNVTIPEKQPGAFSFNNRTSVSVFPGSFRSHPARHECWERRRCSFIPQLTRCNHQTETHSHTKKTHGNMGQRTKRTDVKKKKKKKRKKKKNLKKDKPDRIPIWSPKHYPANHINGGVTNTGCRHATCCSSITHHVTDHQRQKSSKLSTC